MASGGISWPCSAPAARVMLSFIKVPPMSLAPAWRHGAAPSRPIFTHEVWMFVIWGCSDEPRDRVHQDGLAIRRSATRAAFEIDRRFQRHEGQGHELGEAARARLQIAHAQDVARPMQRPVDVAEHDGGRGVEADRVRGLHDLEPLRRPDLVGADDGAHLVVEDLGGGAGQRAQARGFQLGEEYSAAAASVWPRPARPPAARRRARAWRARPT